LKINAAIVGIGASEFGRFLPDTQLKLAAKALKQALDDSGLMREDIDGLSMHMGWPLGLDYDTVADGLGLNIRYVNQAWTHGRFVTNALQHAALAVSAGLANVVACVTAISFTRERDILGGPGDLEGYREGGGTHGEAPPYGLTSPSGGAALSMQRYMKLYDATSEKLAAVPIQIRQNALLNPDAVMKEPLTLEMHQSSRMVVDPLHLFDCCLMTDGAVVTLVTTKERARDLKQKPVIVAGMQGIRSSREEFIFAPPGLGISQQSFSNNRSRPIDTEVFDIAGVTQKDVKGVYTYDAFSPLVLFVLERYGYCGAGEAADFVQNGTIGPGGKLPVNTSGGLLSEAHVAGWNHIREMTRQIRGTAGPRQIPHADVLQWGTVWGDSVILTAA
jgi:acetyl-CoA acetyltransferase